MRYFDHQNMQKKASLFIHVSVAVTVMAASIGIWGWFVHSAIAVQILPEYSSMKFNSALCLLLTACALGAVEKGFRRTGIVLAGIGIFFPLSTLAEYILNTNFGVDTVFVVPFLVPNNVEFAGRMAPNTAIALSLIDAAILFYALINPLRHWGELVLALAGSFVFALGTVPLIGYMGGIEAAHTWGQFAGMALPTSICVIFLGMSLVMCAWKQSSSVPSWLALPVAIGFLIIAIAMWQAVKSYEDIRFDQSLQQEADYIAKRSGDRLTAFYAAIDRIADRWNTAGGTPRNLWEKDMQNYLKDYPFLKKMEWIDADSTLQWAVPLEDDERLLGSKMNSEGTRGETAAIVISKHTSQVTKAVRLAQGVYGFLYMNPLFTGNRFDGLLVSSFALDDVLGRILMRDKNGPFYVSVSEGDVVVFNNTPDNFEPIQRWRKTSLIKSRNSIWAVTVNPAPELLAKKNSPLPMLVLITGLLTSVFATFSILLAFRSRRDAKIVSASEDRLRQIIEINSAISSLNFDLDNFMKLVVERMQVITPATGAVIEIIEGDEMVYKSSDGSLAAHTGMRMKRTGSLSGLCTESNEVMISHDTSTDPRVNAEACRKVGAISMVVVPLTLRGGVVGVLKIVSVTKHAFSKQDVHTVQVMAGLLGGALGQELEIERRRKLEEQLRHLAQYDALTGLPNRILFGDRLSQAIINNRRNGKKMAIIYMDIDHFKSINDKYGHAEGDVLLKSFGSRVQGSLRQGDTLARLGGDEFVAIVENLNDASDAEQVAAKIVAAMQKDFELPTVKIKVGASLGVAISSGPQIDAEAIIKRADEALYEVKKAGRNGFKLLAM